MLFSDVPDGFDLSGLEPATYPSLQLRANFVTTDVDVSAMLNQWRLSWQPVPTTVTGEADLAVGQMVYPAEVSANSLLTYTVTISNGGPMNAYSLTLTDTLPVDAVFQSASEACGQAVNQIVRCTLASLPPNNATKIMVTVTTPVHSTYLTNTVTITAQTFDPNMNNNLSVTTTEIVGQQQIRLPIIFK